VNQADQVRDVLPKVFDRTIAALMEAHANIQIRSASNLLRATPD
jgi:hypothetical protein